MAKRDHKKRMTGIKVVCDGGRDVDFPEADEIKKTKDGRLVVIQSDYGIVGVFSPAHSAYRVSFAGK